MEPLAEHEPEAFARLLRGAAGVPPLPDEVIARLHAHHRELVRWAGRIDLVGPGAADELFERHYGESLAALPWLPEGPFRLVDLGSGAGFPGLILAAARPDAEVWLVEPRQRRAAFLESAGRRMRLGVRVLGARVSLHNPPELPDRLDVVTQRALRLEPRAARTLLAHLAAGARWLVWSGGEPPEMPAELTAGRTLALPASRQRFLREYCREDPR